jgi:hypothetical protein
MKKLVLLFLLLLISIPCFADMYSYASWKKNETSDVGQIANLYYVIGFVDGMTTGQTFARDDIYQPAENEDWIKGGQDAYKVIKEVYTKQKYRHLKTWQIVGAILMCKDKADLYEHLDRMAAGTKQ